MSVYLQDYIFAGVNNSSAQMDCCLSRRDSEVLAYRQEVLFDCGEKKPGLLLLFVTFRVSKTLH